MEPSIDALLSAAPRCLLALHGKRGPTLLPTAFWFDGRHVWITTAAAAPKVRGLRRNPDCRVYVSSVDRPFAALLHGRARVHGLDDPLGLLVHGPMISTALAALAVKEVPSLVERAQQSRVPPASLPRNPVALRIEVAHAEQLPIPDAGQGIAPPLPTVVPPHVRRAFAGARHVVVATRDLDVVPAVWDAGFRLRAVDPLPDTEFATVTVDAEPRGAEALGLSLSGALRDGRLQPRRVTWWHGHTAESGDVLPARAGVTLPD